MINNLGQQYTKDIDYLPILINKDLRSIEVNFGSIQPQERYQSKHKSKLKYNQQKNNINYKNNQQNSLSTQTYLWEAAYIDGKFYLSDIDTVQRYFQIQKLLKHEKDIKTKLNNQKDSIAANDYQQLRNNKLISIKNQNYHNDNEQEQEQQNNDNDQEQQNNGNDNNELQQNKAQNHECQSMLQQPRNSTTFLLANHPQQQQKRINSLSSIQHNSQQNNMSQIQEQKRIFNNDTKDRNQYERKEYFLNIRNQKVFFRKVQFVQNNQQMIQAKVQYMVDEEFRQMEEIYNNNQEEQISGQNDLSIHQITYIQHQIQQNKPLQNTLVQQKRHRTQFSSIISSNISGVSYLRQDENANKQVKMINSKQNLNKITQQQQIQSKIDTEQKSYLSYDSIQKPISKDSIQDSLKQSIKNSQRQSISNLQKQSIKNSQRQSINNSQKQSIKNSQKQQIKHSQKQSIKNSNFLNFQQVQYFEQKDEQEISNKQKIFDLKSSIQKQTKNLQFQVHKKNLFRTTNNINKSKTRINGFIKGINLIQAQVFSSLINSARQNDNKPQSNDIRPSDDIKHSHDINPFKQRKQIKQSKQQKYLIKKRKMLNEILSRNYKSEYESEQNNDCNKSQIQVLPYKSKLKSPQRIGKLFSLSQLKSKPKLLKDIGCSINNPLKHNQSTLTNINPQKQIHKTSLTKQLRLSKYKLTKKLQSLHKEQLLQEIKQLKGMIKNIQLRNLDKKMRTIDIQQQDIKQINSQNIIKMKLRMKQFQDIQIVKCVKDIAHIAYPKKLLSLNTPQQISKIKLMNFQQLKIFALQTYKLLGICPNYTRPQSLLKPQQKQQKLLIKRYKNCLFFSLQTKTIILTYQQQQKSLKLYIGGWQSQNKSIIKGHKYGYGLEITSKYIYQGQYNKHGKKEGQGKLIFGSNSHNSPTGLYKYEGQFLNGKRNGTGKEFNSLRNQVYVGQFNDNARHGKGQVKKLNHKQPIDIDSQNFNFIDYFFNGTFINNKKHEYGEQYFQNNSCYNGLYSQNKFHGNGTFTWPNLSSYNGQFICNLKSGHGTWSSPYPHNYYIGSFLNNKKSGQGKYIWSNGDYYQGQWKEDIKWGQGTLFYGSRVMRGIWEQGKLISNQKGKRFLLEQDQDQDQHANGLYHKQQYQQLAQQKLYQQIDRLQKQKTVL